MGEPKPYNGEEIVTVTVDWESVEKAIAEAQQVIRDKAERDHERLRQNLQRRIADSGRHLSDIALMAGVGENTLRSLLSGSADTGIRRVTLICRALDISVADLLP